MSQLQGDRRWQHSTGSLSRQRVGPKGLANLARRAAIIVSVLMVSRPGGTLPGIAAAAPPGVAADAQEAASIQMRLSELERLLAARTELMADQERTHKLDLEVKSQLATAQQTVLDLPLQVDQMRAQIALLEQSIRGRRSAQTIIVRQGMDAQIIPSRQLFNELAANLVNIETELAKAKIEVPALTKKQSDTESHAREIAAQLQRVWTEWSALLDPLGKLTRREHEAAIPLMDKAIMADATNASALVARGIAYARIGRIEDAVADMTAAIEQGEPYTEVALPVRGRLLLSQGKHRQGLADFGAAIKLHKTQGLPYLLRGQAFCSVRKFPLADKDFRQAARLGDQVSEAERLLALRLISTHDSATQHGRQAREAAERACTLTGRQDWRPLDTLAAVHAALGEFNEAVSVAEEAAAQTWGENRDLCVAHRQRYEQKQPPHIDWQ